MSPCRSDYSPPENKIPSPRLPLLHYEDTLKGLAKNLTDLVDLIQRDPVWGVGFLHSCSKDSPFSNESLANLSVHIGNLTVRRGLDAEVRKTRDIALRNIVDRCNVSMGKAIYLAHLDPKGTRTYGDLFRAISAGDVSADEFFTPFLKAQGFNARLVKDTAPDLDAILVTLHRELGHSGLHQPLAKPEVTVLLRNEYLEIAS